jgi:hypothetical protein
VLVSVGYFVVSILIRFALKYVVLQEAIFNNDYEMTEKCLRGLGTKAKYMLNANQTATQSYLYRVCRYGNAKMAKLLVDYGAIARPHSHTRYSPLYIACYTGIFPVVL